MNIHQFGIASIAQFRLSIILEVVVVVVVVVMCFPFETLCWLVHPLTHPEILVNVRGIIHPSKYSELERE